MNSFQLLSTALLTLGATANLAPAQNYIPDIDSELLGESNGSYRDVRIPKGHIVTAVQVRAGSKVNNLRLVYNTWGREGAPETTSWLGGGTGGSLHTFGVPPGDKLVSMTWYSSTLFNDLVGIKFHTENGLTSPVYGSDSHDRGGYVGYGDSEIVGLWGWEVSTSSGGRFDGIGFGYRWFSNTTWDGQSSADLTVENHTEEFSADPDRSRRFAAIQGRVIGGRVVGIRRKMRDLDGTNTTGWLDWVGQSSGGATHTMYIDSHDYLSEISFNKEDYTMQLPPGHPSLPPIQYPDERIRALRFTTMRGESITFGNPIGSWSHKDTHVHGEISGYYGRTFTDESGSEFLRSLGVYYMLFAGASRSRDMGCVAGPQLGNSLAQLDATQVPGTFRLEILSPSASALLFSPLRQDLPLGSCTIGVDLATAVSVPFSPVSSVSVVQRVDLQVDWRPELLGMVQYWQALSLQPGGPVLGVATASNLLETTIGLDRTWD